MIQAFAIVATLIAATSTISLFADAAPATTKALPVEQSTPQLDSKFKTFTGKIIGKNVRMRINPDLDSPIVAELEKDEYIVVKGESGDFYAVEPFPDLKVYIFRGFVIDDVVEGDRVNIRLSPDRDAPIIGHYSTGQRIDGTVCSENSKWLEISAPQDTKFYIAKEYVEYAGKPELKAIQDKRKKTVMQLLESANLLSQAEMRKAFNEMDIERVTQTYKTIINEYKDFTNYAEKAARELANVQEDYLHRKISFLEAKASKKEKIQKSADVYESSYSEEPHSPTDRMKVWEPVEESLYLNWASMHHAKTMDDFYNDQKMRCRTISGILEAYREPVKNKPGDFILKDRDVSIAYVYSTQVNLEEYLGKRVNLIVSTRPNNNFAFPAYYVLEVE